MVQSNEPQKCHVCPVINTSEQMDERMKKSQDGDKHLWHGLKLPSYIMEAILANFVWWCYYVYKACDCMWSDEFSSVKVVSPEEHIVTSLLHVQLQDNMT